MAVIGLAIGVGSIVFGGGLLLGAWSGRSNLHPGAGGPLGGCLIGMWSVVFGLGVFAGGCLAARDVPPIDWAYGGVYIASVVGPVLANWWLRDWPLRVGKSLDGIRNHLANGVEPQTLEFKTSSPAITVILAGLRVERSATAKTESYRDAPPDAYAERVRGAVAAARARELRRAILAGLPTLAPMAGLPVLLLLRVPMNGFFTWVLYISGALGALGLWIAYLTVQGIRLAAGGIVPILVER